MWVLLLVLTMNQILLLTVAMAHIQMGLDAA